MQKNRINFIVSLYDGHNVQVSSNKPELLRHNGRIRCYRPGGWYLKVLEEMEKCGNRNAKYALQRAF